MKLDWDSFRIILAIGRGGSLLSAGQSLGVNHSTVGRQLSHVEEQLGVKLFDRLSNGLHPTSIGEKAIAHAKQIEATVEKASINLISADDGMSGPIRISVPHNLVPYGLSEYLTEFVTLYPDVYPIITATDDPVNFLSRTVDVVIRANNNPSSGLWGHQIADVRYAFYCTKQFYETWGAKMREDPQNVPLPYIALNDTAEWRDKGQLLRIYPQAQPVAETNGLESILPMVLDGICAGRLARFMGDRNDNLVRIVDCDESCNRSLWILTHPDFRSNERVRTLMDFLHERFKFPKTAITA